MRNVPLSRRHFLKAGIFTAASCLFPLRVCAGRRRQEFLSRRLRFRNTHTDETLSVCYYDMGRYLPDALGAVNHIMRDHRTGQVHAIHPQLLDLLHTVCLETETRRRLHIISGYRCPATNAMLHRHNGGVARNSLHLKGYAADIRMPDVSTRRLRNVARRLKAGGVGYYPRSDFVHLDIGRVRCW